MKNKVIVLKLVGESLYHTVLDTEYVDYINDYELYCPCGFKYDVTFGVEKGVIPYLTSCRFNGIASEIYGGDMCGDVIIIPENEEEFDDIFKDFENIINLEKNSKKQ